MGGTKQDMRELRQNFENENALGRLPGCQPWHDECHEYGKKCTRQLPFVSIAESFVEPAELNKIAFVSTNINSRMHTSLMASLDTHGGATRGSVWTQRTLTNSGLACQNASQMGQYFS